MSTKNALSFRFIDPIYPELPLVIAPSVGYPTEEKIQKVLELYKSADHYLIGCFKGKKLIGVIGFQISSKQVTIHQISVKLHYRLHGIGKMLIQNMVQHFAIEKVLVETDSEAVGFYKGLGFNYKKFNGPYGSRYTCTLKV